MVFGSIITVAIIFFSIDREGDSITWNKWLYYPFVLFGLGILFIGQIHSVGDGFVAYAFDLIFVFPMLYYVWINREDHETFQIILSLAMLTLGIISYCYCFFLASKGSLIIQENRVLGNRSNANFLGMMGITVFIASIFLLIRFFDRISSVICSSLGLGIGIIYVVISASRTALLAEVICLISLVLFSVKGMESVKLPAKNILIRLGIMLVIILLVAMAGMRLDNINNEELKDGISDIEIKTIIKTMEKPLAVSVYAEDDATYVETTEDETRTIVDRLTVPNDLDTFTSGRITIWRVYCENLSWFGKSPYEIRDQLEAGSETRAHNNFLDYLYRCGYIVGSFYIAFYLLTGIIVLKMLFSKRFNKPEHLFLVMIVFTYMLYSMLEIAMLPFIRIIPGLFFLSIAPIMGSKTSL